MTGFLYSAAPFLLSALLVFGLWVAVKMWKQPPGPARALPVGIENITGIAGLLAAGVSITFSAAFASSLGDTLPMSVAFISVFLAVQGAEFTASFHFGRAWAGRHVGLVLATGAAMVLGVGVSIVAGQSLIANRVDALETERLHASANFQAAQSARQGAQERAQSLAVDNSTVAEAQAALAALAGRIRAAEAQAAAWAIMPDCIPKKDGRGNPYTTKAAAACAPLAALRAEAEPYNAVLARSAEYKGAQAHAQSLLGQSLPAGAMGAELPWIAALAAVTGIDAGAIKAHFNLVIAGMTEFIALLFLFLWGKSKAESGGFEVDAVGENVDQRGGAGFVTAQAQHDDAPSAGGLGFTGFVPPNFQGVPPMAKTANDNTPMTVPAMAKTANDSTANGKRGLQAIICIECGAGAMQRTVWQKRCPACTAKKKHAVLTAKRKP
jgi:hypothetical protein